MPCSVLLSLFFSPILFAETLKEFKAFVLEDAGTQKKLDALRAEVQEFAGQYNMPGFDDR